jgi:hypothetical protein
MATITYNPLVIKEVINKNFTFADLSKRFEGVDDSTGNIFCPFHENHDTPAAKMYWDETKEIWIIHCFGECHRNFTAYDYVKRIFCEKYQKYQSPLQFLRANMSEGKLGTQLELYQSNLNDLVESYENEKKIYIDNLFIETGNTIDFIEALYTA